MNTSALDLEHAYIQITHVEPFFTAKELEERKTKFERENNISKFVFETPFTQDGKTHGDVTTQCMKKTILTSECLCSFYICHLENKCSFTYSILAGFGGKGENYAYRGVVSNFFFLQLHTGSRMSRSES